MLHVPNFCPECGSSEATSRFCSSCGYSLASTPAPPDARTRVEETPVFRPFAPPVVETWDSIAADPWSSTAGVTTPPPVRNVVTQTHAAVGERLLTITRLTVLKWLWRICLLTTGVSGAWQYSSFISEPFFSTSAPGDLASMVLLVALLVLTGVAANAARQAGAKTPHPVLAVLLVIGAALFAYVIAGLISPELRSETAISTLYNKGLDRRFLYGLALVLENLAIYVAVLTPVVALTNALEDKYPGDPLLSSQTTARLNPTVLQPGSSLWRRLIGTRGMQVAEPVRVGWGRVLGGALVLGAYDVIAEGLVFGSNAGPLPSEEFVKRQLPLYLFVAPLILWSNLKFNKISPAGGVGAGLATATAIAPSEPRGFWRGVRWWFLFIMGGFAVVALLMLLAVLTTDFG